MTDNQLSDLFARGTAPDDDSAFVASAAADIGRARLRGRPLALARPATGVLALSGAVHVAAGVIRPVLAPRVDGAPEFMGVPMPVALDALAAGPALSARRYVLSR